jgi:chromate transporter
MADHPEQKPQSNSASNSAPKPELIGDHTRASAESTASATLRPSSKTELFFTFASIALQGFGGVLTIIQREMVDKRRWLTQKEFTEDWAVSQILPGGNVVNLCIILGNRYFGWRGALAALAGILLPPLVIVLILASLYNQFVDVPQVAGAVRGMGAAAAGLIGAVSLKMLAGLKKNELGVGICAALIAMTFIAVGLLRWPLVYVVLGLGVPAMGYAIWALPRKEGAAP